MTTLDDTIKIARHIRSGAYFDAFQARDTKLDRPVFLKVARELNDDQAKEIVAAHFGIWRAFSSIHMDGMPAILHIGRHNGRLSLVTEWIEGLPLTSVLDAGTIAYPHEFLFLLLRRCLFILRGLHSNALIHGDINPGNILIDPQNRQPVANIVDPAPLIALPAPNDPTKKIIFGTRRYLAPELLGGHTPTPRTDLFALGTVIADAARQLQIAPPNLIPSLTAPDPVERPFCAEEAYSMLHTALWNVPESRDGGWWRKTAPSDQLDGVISMGVQVRRPMQPEDYVTGMHQVPKRDADQEFEEKPSSEDGVTRENRLPQPTANERLEVSRALAVPVRVDPLRPQDEQATAAISVPAPELSKKTAAALADFSVVAPSLIQAGRTFVIEVWICPSERRATMLQQATQRGRMIERGGRSHIDLARDIMITVILKLPDFEVSDPVETMGWNGDIRNVGFIVKAPASLEPGVYPGAAKLMQGQIPFASIVFDLEIASVDGPIEAPTRPRDAHVQRIANAFASYSSLDRAEVLRRVQGIRAVGTNVFLDIINLRSGIGWEKAVYREIDASDGFFLFWSRNAAQSPWVEREWRYALKRRGLDFINPLPLEDPRVVEPPHELRSKHFDDMLLAFIKAEEAFRNSKDP